MMPEHFWMYRLGKGEIKNGFIFQGWLGNAAETEEGAAHPLAPGFI